MAVMARVQKQQKTSGSFQYEAEDVKPRDGAADDDFIDDYIRRNGEAPAESIEIAERDFREGRTFGHDEVMAEIEQQRQKRKAKSG